MLSLDNSINNTIFLLKVAILHFSYVTESLPDILIQVVHVDSLELSQMEFNFSKVLQLDSQLFLDVFAIVHELVECQHGLWLSLHDVPHHIH